MRIIILLFLIINSFSYCQTDNWAIHFSASSFKDCVYINDNLGYILTQDNRLLKTIDSGITWNETLIKLNNNLLNNLLDESFGHNYSLNKIFSLNENKIWIVGDNILLKTIDGGISWNLIAKDMNFLEIGFWPNFDFIDIHFFNDNLGFLMNEHGEVFKTTNGGLNWTSFIASNSAFSYGTIKSLNEETSYIATGGNLHKTIDSGNTWTLVAESFPNLFDFADTNIGFSVVTNSIGSNYEIFKTINGGNEWVSIVQNIRYIRDLIAINTNTFLISGRPNDSDDSGIYKSTDNGNSWHLVSVPTSSELNLYKNNNKIYSTAGFFGGMAGASLYKSNDNGDTWLPLLEKNLYSSRFINYNEDLYFLGDDASNDDVREFSIGKINKFGSSYGVVNRDTNMYFSGGSITADIFLNSYDNTWYTRGWKSTDNLQNFTEIIDHDSYYQIPFLFFNNTIFSRGKDLNNTGIFKSIDNGQNWINIIDFDTFETNSSNYDGQLHFINQDIGYFCGNDKLIIKTIDGGNSWEVKNWDQDSQEIDDLNSIYFHNDTQGWAVGRGNTILYTNDGGESWINQDSGLEGNISFQYIGFYNNKLWVSGSEIIYTDDFGSSWHNSSSNTNFTANELFFFGENLGYASTNSAQLIKWHPTCFCNDEPNVTINQNEINISWNEIPSADGYIIKISKNESGNWDRIYLYVSLNNSISIQSPFPEETEISITVVPYNNANNAICPSINLSTLSLIKPNVDSKNFKPYIFPNPTNEEFNIKTNKKILSVSVFNSNGQFITNKKNIENLESGTYIIKIIYQDNSTSTHKLIVK